MTGVVLRSGVLFEIDRQKNIQTDKQTDTLTERQADRTTEYNDTTDFCVTIPVLVRMAECSKVLRPSRLLMISAGLF